MNADERWLKRARTGGTRGPAQLGIMVGIGLALWLSARALFPWLWDRVAEAADMMQNGYYQHLYSVEGAAMLQCDFICMIGPQMFRRWVLPALEEDMMALGSGEAGQSPDRADALVWAITHLMLETRAEPRLRAL